MVYIRQLRDKAFWAENLVNRDAQDIDRAAEEWLSTPFLSVYASESADDTVLIALALSAGRSHANSFHFLELDPEDVRALGIPEIRRPGVTAIDRVNDLHLDLDLGGDARSLLARLLDRGLVIKSIAKAELKRAAKVRLRGALPEDHWLLK